MKPWRINRLYWDIQSKIKWSSLKNRTNTLRSNLSECLADTIDVPEKTLRDYEEKLQNQEDFHRRIRTKRSNSDVYGDPGLLAAELLHLLVRVDEPEVVVQTGVLYGLFDAYILLGMNFNDTGRLFSIDLPDHEKEHNVGYFIPDELKDRWDLTLGNSRDELESILQTHGPVDWFIHDSDHTYEHMYWEYETALPYIRNGGRLLSHDVYATPAFSRFCEDHNLESTETAGIGFAKK